MEDQGNGQQNGASRRAIMKYAAASVGLAAGGPLIGSTAAQGKPVNNEEETSAPVINEAFTGQTDGFFRRNGKTIKLVVAADLSYFGSTSAIGSYIHKFYLCVNSFSLMRDAEGTFNEWKKLDPYTLGNGGHSYLINDMNVEIEASESQNNLFDMDDDDVVGVDPGPGTDADLSKIREFGIDQAVGAAIDSLPGPTGLVFDAHGTYKDMVNDAGMYDFDDPFGISNEDRVTFDVPYPDSAYNLKPSMATLGYEFYVETDEPCEDIRLSITADADCLSNELHGEVKFSRNYNIGSIGYEWPVDGENHDCGDSNDPGPVQQEPLSHT